MNKTEIPSKLKVGLVQMTSLSDIPSNLKQMVDLLPPHLEEFDFIFYPETSLYFRTDEEDSLPEINVESSFLQEFLQMAQSKNVIFAMGSPYFENGKFFNALLWVTPQRIFCGYKKMHLFDVHLPSGVSARESAAFAAGHDLMLLDAKGWKWGQSICYDVRFPEIYVEYRKAGADVLLVPSAFFAQTGRVHWKELLQARAIENQAYLIAPNQGGIHRGKKSQRETWGHSLIIDPWGRILAEGGKEPQFLEATLDPDLVNAVRRQIPMADHRKKNHSLKISKID